MENYKLVKNDRQDLDALDVDPESLLPILKRWRAVEPHKYRTMVEMICCSAGVDPAELSRKKGRRS